MEDMKIMNPAEIGPLATMKETCQILRLSKPTIYNLIRAGELESLHFGMARRALRITMRSIHSMLKRSFEADNPKARNTKTTNLSA
jgi:excisionase family DNA binding protein